MKVHVPSVEAAAERQTEESAEIAYVLSSFYGFGHSSRAIAIAQALAPAQPITFIARVPVHDFLRANLDEYDAPIGLVEPDYEKLTPDEEYIVRNQHLSDVIGNAKVVVNDFHMQIPALRALMNKSGVRLPFIGVYHSISGYESEDDDVNTFQNQFLQLAEGLDYLFLAEPKITHEAPYELDSGTQVIPCAPIVRKPSVDPAEVKQRFGMGPDEEFIYVQGGGLLSGSELEYVARSLQSVMLNGLKVVIVRRDIEQVVSNDNTVYVPPSTDGHNVIAASAGVITKPGMGTIAEAIAARKPLLLVDYPTPEAKAKYAMMNQILGDDLVFRLNVAQELASQIINWLDQSSEIQDKLSKIRCDGAQTVASALSFIAEKKNS